jgi:alpha-galactosidase
LLRRFPKLEIDNANWRVTGPDLEVMKRSIGSLTRSELTNGGIPNSVADQAETAELSLWIPLDANILNAADTYDFRSTATTGVAIGLNLRSKYIPVDELRKAISEVKELRPYWLGDFYPLTPVTQDQNAWLGWQFNRPDLNSGYAMMFRRSHNGEATKEISLRGLDSRAEYQVSFAETHDPGPIRLLKGVALAHLRVPSSSQSSSILIRYKKVSNSSRTSPNQNR